MCGLYIGIFTVWRSVFYLMHYSGCHRGEILKQKSWPKNELTKNPNSTFVSDSGFFVSKRSTFLLKNFQPWVRMHRLGPCSFIPEVSHAIIIKQRNRNLCDTGSVRKSRKINGFTTTFRLHNGYNPSMNSLSLANHDMRKTWYCVWCVFWRDV